MQAMRGHMFLACWGSRRSMLGQVTVKQVWKGLHHKFLQNKFLSYFQPKLTMASSDVATTTGSGNEIKARVVLQQCLSAKLQVQPASEDSEAKFVEIKRGLLVYICFMKNASRDILEKIVKFVLNTRLSRTSDGKLVSILDLPGDVLIVPQATLGGRPKGRVMQYHNNVDKTEGHSLYTEFAEQCLQTVESNAKCEEAGTTVKWGTYGNTQVLSIVTNGPYTHLVEF